jgi:UDP-N-acetylmuramyl pentapeptide phosphotransferase/UDP-N-acetylglucosamine-1-phosphate transferase
MKQPVKFIVSLLVVALLGNATGVAQSRSGELGRGFPYTSGGEWSWGPWVFVLLLLFVLGLVGMVKDKLADQPWWHTLIVVVATLLSSVALTVNVSRPYPAEIGLAVFMLVPSFVCIAFLYLAIMRLARSRHD